MEIPVEIARICFGCPHLKKKGGLSCSVRISQCHSARVRKWRKEVEKQR